jgi:hypothetical protein
MNYRCWAEKVSLSNEKIKNQLPPITVLYMGKGMVRKEFATMDKRRYQFEKCGSRMCILCMKYQIRTNLPDFSTIST